MSRTDIELESIPRKTTVIFFIIDTSGSMAGDRIGAVNAAIEETLEKMRKMNEDNADISLEVAFLEFSTGARWNDLSVDGPISVENCYWTDLEADGVTHMGEAFRMLEDKLHKDSGFMKRASGSYAPVLFLMSDGEPNDDYVAPLGKLQNNGWYKASIKVALAVGDESNDSVLEEFTGSKEAVVRVRDGENAGEKLKKMIQFIAITSSQVASTPLDTGDKSKQEQFVENLQNAIADDDFDIGDASDGSDDEYEW